MSTLLSITNISQALTPVLQPLINSAIQNATQSMLTPITDATSGVLGAASSITNPLDDVLSKVSVIVYIFVALIVTVCLAMVFGCVFHFCCRRQTKYEIAAR